jgi:hypothetical protein
MNPLNYATLEASQRLHAKGIVLETEKCWIQMASGKYSLVNTRKPTQKWFRHEDVPAPSMAEVWRELPGEIGLNYTLDVTKIGKETQALYSKIDGFDNYCTKGSSCNTNPTDALIDLLIWVMGQRKEEGK